MSPPQVQQLVNIRHVTWDSQNMSETSAQSPTRFLGGCRVQRVVFRTACQVNPKKTVGPYECSQQESIGNFRNGRNRKKQFAKYRQNINERKGANILYVGSQGSMCLLHSTYAYKRGVV